MYEPQFNIRNLCNSDTAGITPKKINKILFSQCKACTALETRQVETNAVRPIIKLANFFFLELYTVAAAVCVSCSTDAGALSDLHGTA